MDTAFDLTLPGAPSLQDWKRIGEIMLRFWPKGLYYDAAAPTGIPLQLAGHRLHYIPSVFVVVKDEPSAYAAEHGHEYSCLVQFKIHMLEGIVAVVESDSEGDEVAQTTLNLLHAERIGLKP